MRQDWFRIMGAEGFAKTGGWGLGDQGIGAFCCSGRVARELTLGWAQLVMIQQCGQPLALGIPCVPAFTTHSCYQGLCLPWLITMCSVPIPSLLSILMVQNKKNFSSQGQVPLFHTCSTAIRKRPGEYWHFTRSVRWMTLRETESPSSKGAEISTLLHTCSPGTQQS